MKSNTPSFTRRDFQFLADFLNETKPHDDRETGQTQWEGMALELTARLSATNPNFNKSKFLEAAGFKED